LISQYTALYSDLDKMYSESISGPYQDLSNDGTVAALQSGRITGYWRPTVIVTDHLNEIKRLWDISRDISYLDIKPLSPAARWLLSHGYTATPTFTHVIDIMAHEWSHIRKSYQNLINRDIENCSISTNMMEYKELHREMCGRQTRPHQSWKIQQLMIDRDEGFIVKKDDGAAFFVCNDDWAYYASGKCRSNSHAIIYRGIQECQNRGIKFLDMGEQVFFGNEKMVNISNFKRGFGGSTHTRILCEKS